MKRCCSPSPLQQHATSLQATAPLLDGADVKHGSRSRSDSRVNLCPPSMLCRLSKGDEKIVPHLSVHLHAHHNSDTVNNLVKAIV